MNLVQRLIDFAMPLCHGIHVRDIRLGLGYTCVELGSGDTGLAGTPGRLNPGSCSYTTHAGSLSDLGTETLLNGLNSHDPLERAIGLAVFNALSRRIDRDFVEQESISLLGIRKDDHVVMVGYFAPLISRVRETGCRLDIVERNPAKPGIIDPGQGLAALSRCDVAIITATSIVNGSADGLLESLRKNRSAVLLGPSTPLCPEAFTGTRVTQLSGAQVADAEMVKRIVSQGGGTRQLKRGLRFVSISI